MRPVSRPYSPLAALLLAVLLAWGCSRVPKIIVLHDPLSAEEHIELGLAYERKGELDPAGREYEKALRKDPGSFRARVNLGNVRLAAKDYGRAREEYHKALVLRPNDAEAANNLAWADILSGGDVGESLARMEAVLSPPGVRSATLYDTLGVLRMHAGSPEAAAEAFDAAEKICTEAAPSTKEACSPELLKEIGDHRRELRRRFPPPPQNAPLIK